MGLLHQPADGQAFLIKWIVSVHSILFLYFFFNEIKQKEYSFSEDWFPCTVKKTNSASLHNTGHTAGENVRSCHPRRNAQMFRCRTAAAQVPNPSVMSVCRVKLPSHLCQQFIQDILLECCYFVLNGVDVNVNRRGSELRILI